MLIHVYEETTSEGSGEPAVLAKSRLDLESKHTQSVEVYAGQISFYRIDGYACF